jgi:hypothetical protein
MNEEYYMYYRDLAEKGALPADFDQWGLANEGGWTIAHRAAWFRYLPDDFDRWDWAAVYTGRTVAHEAAASGYLPVDFNQWALADKEGWTVAHEAAECGHLPVDFDQWGLADNKERPVLRALLFIPKAVNHVVSAKSDKHMSRWGKERPLCKTDADWEVFKTELPEIYQKYSISECMLDVDNDQEALQGVSQGALRGALL